MKMVQARMSQPPIFRTCPFLIIAMTSLPASVLLHDVIEVFDLT